MAVRFIHTADWQIGKPYSWVTDPDKRGILQQKRIAAIDRIAEAVASEKASFVVIAGDLFDSPSPNKSTVSAVCGAIGRMQVPVYVIPGNHDHGGPLGCWDKPFFLQECQSLAPKLQVLLEAKPFVTEHAVILPCPLLKRHEVTDTTAWLRNLDLQEAGIPEGLPRIVIAHGSTMDFGSSAGEDDEVLSLNRIDLGSLKEADLDYIALGDWHGLKQVGGKAWYSGTPETDRFPRGEGYDPGNILVVEASRGLPPRVEKRAIADARWHELAFHFDGDAGVEGLKEQIASLAGGEVNKDLMRLTLSGMLGLDGFNGREELMETYRARFISLRIDDGVVLQPTEAELKSITAQTEDPLSAQVATRLVEMIGKGGEASETAEYALRQLYLSIRNN